MIAQCGSHCGDGWASKLRFLGEFLMGKAEVVGASNEIHSLQGFHTRNGMTTCAD
jgi:hypothetical protein